MHVCIYETAAVAMSVKSNYAVHIYIIINVHILSFCIDTVYTVCALIFAGFKVRGFRGSAAIREYFVREYLNVTVNGHVYTQLESIDDVMRN